MNWLWKVPDRLPVCVRRRPWSRCSAVSPSLKKMFWMPATTRSCRKTDDFLAKTSDSTSETLSEQTTESNPEIRGLRTNPSQCHQFHPGKSRTESGNTRSWFMAMQAEATGCWRPEANRLDQQEHSSRRAGPAQPPGLATTRILRGQSQSPGRTESGWPGILSDATHRTETCTSRRMARVAPGISRSRTHCLKPCPRGQRDHW